MAVDYRTLSDEFLIADTDLSEIEGGGAFPEHILQSALGAFVKGAAMPSISMAGGDIGQNATAAPAASANAAVAYWDLSASNLSQDWTNTNQITVNDDWSGVASIIGFRGDDLVTTIGADPQTITTTSTVVNVIANQTNPNTLTTGGVAEFQITNPVVALQGSATADAPYLALYLNASGRQGVTISYNLRDIDGSADDAVQPVALQYRLNDTAAWVNVPAGYVADASSGPSLATMVTPVSVTLPAAVNNVATLQVRIITANAVGSDEWIGIDDIKVTSSALAASGGAGSFAIAGASVTEGDAGTVPITFAVTRTGGSTGAVDLNYTVDLGSGAGHPDASDFQAGTPLTGTVHFNDGQTSQSIVLNVAGDTIVEPTETFTVTISGATAGTIATATATGTIIDNDTPPAGVLSIAAASAIEGDSGTTPMMFTVTRASGSYGAVSANYAVSFNGTANAADLSGPTAGTVSFADGETSKTITINVAGDTVYEQNETFSVVLSSPTGNATLGTASATGTIINDDAVPPTPALFINEIHYDNFGTDTGEAIEIAGAAGSNLAGWQLVLYNGNGGAAYSTTNLSGTIADQNNGYGTLSFSYPVNGIQNGNPDGIALVAPDGSVVQFLSYGGVMTAAGGPANGLVSTDIGVQEPGAVGQSLQLTGTGATYADFTWAPDAQNTFGAVNTGQSFLPATGTGYFRVNDPSVAEGNSGTHALTFQITRSGGSAAAGAVDYQISFDGTADASDFAPGQTLAGTLSFGVGETVKTVTLNVLGDTTPEVNETLSLHLSNPTGNSAISDDTGIGTIVNDDPITLAIYQIQGAAQKSAYVGQQVTTTGIVTASGNSGFYIQDATGDGNSATSDAIFVATTQNQNLAAGTSVTVSGTIAEVGASGSLTVTQFANGSSTYVVNSTGNALPAAVLIGADGLHPPTSVIDDDHLTSYDPTTDGIDFYESLEGMRVTIETPLVVARSDGGTYVVASDGAGATGINAHGGITISAGDNNPERILLHSQTDIYAGFTGSYTQDDLLSNVTGVMNYAGGTFRVEVTAPVTQLRDANLQPEVTAITKDATHLVVASFNMENADVSDGAQKFNLIAQTIVNNLKAPTIILAQEIQDADGAGAGTDYTGTATANAVIAAVDAIGGPHYSYIEVAPTANNTTGGEPNGNIRPGIFYLADQVSYVTGSARQIIDPAYDGSRKPLVADFMFNGQLVTMIDMHSTSRLGGTSLYGSIQPPIDGGDAARTAQADAAKAYIDSILASDPNHMFVVGGDFNGFYFETALQHLGSNGITNLTTLLPVEERYSYLFEGNLQQIDNILVSNNLLSGAQFDAVHINTLLPANAPMATDHDQVISSLYIPPVNHAPVAVNDAVAVNEDATTANLYAALLGNDTDQDAGTTLTITGVNTTGTQGHVLFDAVNHTLQYVADADAFDELNTGQTAADSFTYTVSDGTLTSTATVAVTVTGIADGTTFNGSAGNDVNNGTPGDDRLYGNAGNDTLHGGAGADFISGGIGNDTLYGDAGRDVLLGGAGNDMLFGGDGNDYLSGDAGTDTLTGGAGADTFAFGAGGGRDTITDFDTTLDRLLLTGGLTVTGTSIADVNRDGIDDAVFTFSGGTSAVLLGVHDIAAVHIDMTSAPLITEPTFG